MRVRHAKPADLAGVARLYYETVHRINARDYTARQLRAWAPRVYPPAWWRRRWHHYEVFVAVCDGAVCGFAELGQDGEVDCFYVHHAWQARGVGTALMARLERVACRRGAARLRADVSLTAEGFFRRQGFRVLRRQFKIYRNCSFKQALMEKRLRHCGRGSSGG